MYFRIHFLAAVFFGFHFAIAAPEDEEALRNSLNEGNYRNAIAALERMEMDVNAKEGSLTRRLNSYREQVKSILNGTLSNPQLPSSTPAAPYSQDPTAEIKELLEQLKELYQVYRSALPTMQTEIEKINAIQQAQ